MTMVGGMQGFTMGDAAYHRNEPDCKRELAQAKELLANQTAYIKVLQDENLQLLKRLNQPVILSEWQKQEALIAELLSVIRNAVVAAAHPSNEAKKDCYNILSEALEKVGK